MANNQKDPTRNVKVVLRVDEVRAWVAWKRGLDIDSHKMEKLLTIRKALVAGGLIEPIRNPDEEDARIKIDGLRRAVLANYQIEATETWKTDIVKYHMEPQKASDMEPQVLPYM